MAAGTGNRAPSRPAGRFDFRGDLAASSYRGVALAFTNMFLATLFIFFAIANAKSFLANPRLSVLLIVITESIVAFFLIVRRDPEETHHSWQTWVTTTLGTLAPFLLRPIDAEADHLIGSILQVSGFLLQIAALVALNRCLGLLPAYRGVKSKGLYAWVRHPLYLAYVVTYLGYYLSNPSTANLFVIVSGTGFLVLRIWYEESLLLRYSEYASYARKTRWRLLPAVW